MIQFSVCSSYGRMREKEDVLSLDKIRAMFAYDEQSGTLTWMVGKAFGRRAGTKTQKGYFVVALTYGGKSIRVRLHRLVWFYVHGRWPSEFIDHINGDRSDNRLINLREASLVENNRNRKAQGSRPIKGVCYWKDRGKWLAQIRFDGRAHYIGIFDTAEEAGAAYAEAAKKHHGAFARAS